MTEPDEVVTVTSTRPGAIPLGARILAIADAYDAMTSKRHHGTQKSSTAALKILYEQRGKQFDQDLVVKFIECVGLYPPGCMIELSSGEVGIVIASDADTGERVVLCSGRVAPAVRASCSVPGLVTPVEIDGRQLVDGGIVDNLPADAVREMGADYVIGVDVFEPHYHRTWGPLARGLTGVESLVPTVSQVKKRLLQLHLFWGGRPS